MVLHEQNLRPPQKRTIRLKKIPRQAKNDSKILKPDKDSLTRLFKGEKNEHYPRPPFVFAGAAFADNLDLKLVFKGATATPDRAGISFNILFAAALLGYATAPDCKKLSIKDVIFYLLRFKWI